MRWTSLPWCNRWSVIVSYLFKHWPNLISLTMASSQPHIEVHLDTCTVQQGVTLVTIILVPLAVNKVVSKTTRENQLTYLLSCCRWSKSTCLKAEQGDCCPWLPSIVAMTTRVTSQKHHLFMGLKQSLLKNGLKLSLVQICHLWLPLTKAVTTWVTPLNLHLTLGSKWLLSKCSQLKPDMSAKLKLLLVQNAYMNMIVRGMVHPNMQGQRWDQPAPSKQN